LKADAFDVILSGDVGRTERTFGTKPILLD
jgi:hypothetical protein